MFVGITTLAKELAAALLFRDAHMLKGVYGSLPGLYEWLWDQPAPSSDPSYTQTVKGEDHSDSSLDGGIPIPKNCFISAGYGSADQFMWKLANLLSATGWVYADADYTTGRGTNLNYHWTGYVEPGLDTATYPTVFAEAIIALHSGSTAAYSVRIYNYTLSQYSATTTIAAAPVGTIEHIIIEDIPISGGIWNDMRLEYSTSGENVDIWTYGAQFYTVYKAGAESRSAHAAPLSQPPSAGTEAA